MSKAAIAAAIASSTYFLFANSVAVTGAAATVIGPDEAIDVPDFDKLGPPEPNLTPSPVPAAVIGLEAAISDAVKLMMFAVFERQPHHH